MQSSDDVSAACALGDKIYVFYEVLETEKSKGKNFINILHNPGASFSSLDPPRWQVIVAPQDCASSRRCVAFVPLNSTEIAILGGCNNHRYCKDVTIFNTSTDQFKKEIEEGSLTFLGRSGMSAQVRENFIFALVSDQNDKQLLINYTKGDTGVTSIPISDE